MNQIIRSSLMTAIVIGNSFVNAAETNSKQIHFATPEEAVKTLVSSIKEDNKQKLLEVLGADGKPLIESGDEAEDKANRERFLEAYEAGHKLDKISDTEYELSLGKDDWPFPIPLLHEAKGWYFDTDAGKDEILKRRIGRNELSAIKALKTSVDAQHDFQQPYMGYYYRTLTTQGTDTGSLFAWPTNYGNTGIMTFFVDKQGKIFEKDLGPNSEARIQKIKTFNPDKTWTEVNETE